jgi:hypothetical protein
MWAIAVFSIAVASLAAAIIVYARIQQHHSSVH